MTATLTSGFIVSIIFTFLSLVHLYWAISGGITNDYIIPEVNNKILFSPSRLVIFGIGIGFLIFAFIILGHIGVFELLSLTHFFKYGTWSIVLFFSGRVIGDFKHFGIFKKIRDTKFAQWDSFAYIPVSLFIIILILIVIYYQQIP